MSKQEARVALAEVYTQIEAHYWKFTRSARPGGWPTALYRRRAQLEVIVHGRIIS